MKTTWQLLSSCQSLKATSKWKIFKWMQKIFPLWSLHKCWKIAFLITYFYLEYLRTKEFADHKQDIEILSPATVKLFSHLGSLLQREQIMQLKFGTKRCGPLLHALESFDYRSEWSLRHKPIVSLFSCRLHWDAKSSRSSRTSKTFGCSIGSWLFHFPWDVGPTTRRKSRLWDFCDRKCLQDSGDSFQERP